MATEPLIFDTTIWIEFLNGRPTAANQLLTSYINNDYPILLIPIIIQEILQGVREDTKYVRLKNTLSGYSKLYIEAMEAAIGAADLYRDLRKKGITIRKSNDCLIAFYSLYFNIAVVHNDSDFDLIGQHSKVRVRRS